MRIARVISIRQPYVEQIFRGTKKGEFRNRLTQIRERVWIYASLKPAVDPAEWRRLRKNPGELPVGKILGSVEIVDCRERGPKDFVYRLKNPVRLARPKTPKNHPQPVFWRPRF